MEMTKQRKMLIAVLGIGLGGLVLDKFVLAPPDSASADAGSVPIEATTPVPPPVSTQTVGPQAADNQADDSSEAGSLPSYASLTERLMIAQSQQSATADGQGEADPFSLPEDWAPRTTQTDQTQDQVVIQETPQLEQRLLSQYHLLSTSQASLPGGRTVPIAIVAGESGRERFLRIGDTVEVSYPNPAAGGEALKERFTLVQIGNRYAVWESTTQAPQLSVQMIMETAEIR